MLPGSRRVVLVKHLESAQESREHVSASVQPAKGFFPLETPIEVGDVIEVPDPRRGSTDPIRYHVAKIEIFDVGRLGHIEATWGSPPAGSPTRKKVLVDLADLHEAIVRAAGPMYQDGHFGPAAFQAFKAVEIRLRDLSGLDLSGRDLAAHALGGEPPVLAVSRHSGRTGADEQEGIKLLLMGAFQGLRNPGGHELTELDEQEALEQLALASLVMRWLDAARPKDPSTADQPRNSQPTRREKPHAPKRVTPEQPSARLAVLRELRDLARQQARTSAVLDLDIGGLVAPSGIPAERLQDALVDLLAEGLAEPYAATMGQSAAQGACRITSEGMRELRGMEA